MVEALADLLTTPPSPVEVMIESLAVQARETSGQALHAATDNSHKLSDFQQTLAVIIENNPEMIAFAEANQAKHQAIIDKYHQQQAEKEALRIPTREDIEKINKDLDWSICLPIKNRLFSCRQPLMQKKKSLLMLKWINYMKY